jgi:OOP family OmpA-OmpF porin
MKHLNKLITAVVLLVGLLSQAQDVNNTWAISFGTNAVDTRVSAASSIKDQFSIILIKKITGMYCLLYLI